MVNFITNILVSVIYFLFYLVALICLISAYSLKRFDLQIKITMFAYLIYFIAGLAIDITTYSYAGDTTNVAEILKIIDEKAFGQFIAGSIYFFILTFFLHEMIQT